MMGALLARGASRARLVSVVWLEDMLNDVVILELYVMDLYV